MRYFLYKYSPFQTPDLAAPPSMLSFVISQGAFHSTKTSGLNFRQLPVANGTAFLVDCTGNDDFPTFPKKRTTSRGIPKYWKKFPRKFSFHSTLLPEFLKFSIEWFAFRKFNSFRNFWKLFQELSVPFAAVSKFSKVLVEWKAPPDSVRHVTRPDQGLPSLAPGGGKRRDPGNEVVL